MFGELSKKVLTGDYSLGELDEMHSELKSLEAVILNKIDEITYLKSNVVVFIEDGYAIEGRRDLDVYNEYVHWCFDGDDKGIPTTRVIFNRIILFLLGLTVKTEWVNGKLIKVYRKV